MATTRASGYVVTHTVWNDVLSRLTDDGVTFSGNFNGGTIAGTTLSLSSTAAMAGVVTITAASTRGLLVTRASADAGIQIESTGGSGKTYGITSNTSGVLRIQDDSDGTPRIELSGNNVSLVATSGVTNSNYYNSATAQPGFLAYNSADDTGVSSGAAVDFNTEIYDDASNFASDTFTAPVTGRYLLIAAVDFSNVSGAARDVGAYIVTSNFSNGYYIGYQSQLANNGQVILAGSVVADMEAGDTATVNVYLDSSTITVRGGSTGLTYFCGRLLP